MDASPLSKLPQELRDKIYELALFVPEGIEFLVMSGHDVYRKRERKRRAPPDLMGAPRTLIMQAGKCTPGLLSGCLSLAQCCKQLRLESLPIFYATNTFSFEHRMLYCADIQAQQSGISRVKKWVDLLGEHCESLRAVTIQLPVKHRVGSEYTTSQLRDVLIEYKDVFPRTMNLTIVAVSPCNDGLICIAELPMLDPDQALLNAKDMWCMRKISRRRACWTCPRIQKLLCATIELLMRQNLPTSESGNTNLMYKTRQSGLGKAVGHTSYPALRVHEGASGRTGATNGEKNTDRVMELFQRGDSLGKASA